VRRISSELARIYGIRDRGRDKPGAWADLMLFDPARRESTRLRPPGRRRAPDLRNTRIARSCGGYRWLVLEQRDAEQVAARLRCPTPLAIDRLPQ
jgi:N-acyl-D-aspartate/D-glutamate deacylase